MLKKTFCHTLIIGVCIWFGGLIGFGYTINHFKTDAVTETDAIVVLTGGRNRISEAVKLLNRGKAGQLLISGVSKGMSLETLKKRRDVEITTTRWKTPSKRRRGSDKTGLSQSGW